MRDPHGEDDLLSAVRAFFHHAEVQRDGLWLRVRRERLQPDVRSGWKLHLSAMPANVAALLAAALPALAASELPFKLVRSIEVLEDLNDGRYGLTQVGKAMTVYPPDEPAAVALAGQLRDALRGFDGPDIPTDFRLFADAPLFCRFGPFDYRVRIDALGQKRRLLAHPELGDVIDPADGGEAAPVIPTLLPYDRPADHLAFLRPDYLFIRLLQLTGKGGVFLALARRAPASGPLLIKTARKGTNADRFARDALWGARHEHDLVRDLAGIPGVPPCPEISCDAERSIALIRPWLDGTTFWERWTGSAAATATTKQQLAAMLRRLMEVVNTAHECGVIVRDLAPANILDRDSDIVILDWELAHRLGSDAPPYRRGTPGFYDPTRDRFHAPDPQDDYYALLALAFMAFTGVHPALLSSSLRDAKKTGAFLTGELSRRWEMAWTRLDDAKHFQRVYSALLGIVFTGGAAAREAPAHIDATTLRDALWQDVLRSAEALYQSAIDIDDVTVYSGLAGRLITATECGVEALLLADTVERLRPVVFRLLDEAAAVRHIPGLHFGLPGVALAVAVLGVLWQDKRLQDAGVRTLTALELPGPVPPDLCHGLAGYTLALLAAHRITGAGDCVDRAIAVGNLLLRHGIREEEDFFWPWPTGPYGTLSGARQFGFAHGLAGVGLALLQLHKATGDDSYRHAAEGALDTLGRHARPVEDAGDAVWWPVSATDHTVWNAWCHGTPGVVKTLSLAAAVLGRNADRHLLERAMRGMYAANNPGFCLCHGIASRLDAALDASAATPVILDAHRDAAILAALDLPGIEVAAQHLERGGRSRGLMTGAAGVWRTLLRYSGGFQGPFGAILP